MSFSQALSGLNAQSQKLGTIGNNIANSQTVGFKGSNVQFSDVFANSRVGLGTRVSTVLQNFSEGNIESTNRNLDLAVAGEGFFRYQQPSGEVAYSRNGQLSMTATGDLINAQGARIMGYQANAAGEVMAGGGMVPLNVPTDDLDAKATSEVSLVMNLDAGEEVLDAADFDLDNPDTYHYATNSTVFDSLGNAHSMTLYFIKTQDGGALGNSSWSVRAMIGEGGAPAEIDDFVTFNNSGRLTAGGTGTFEFAGLPGGVDENGAEIPLSFQLDLSKATQFGNDSRVSSSAQDGYASGSLVGITIEEDGTVMRNFSNEQSLAAGQIGLVSFRNPEGLNPVGDNLWAATQASGNEVPGVPGVGLLGSIVSGAVETSNVDMARELVDMIVAQRAYQANSQTIKTQDELLRDAINLR